MNKLKKLILCLFLLLSLLCALLTLSACDGNSGSGKDDPAVTPEPEKPDNTDDPADPDGQDDPDVQKDSDRDPTLLYLGENGKFSYSFVFAGEINITSATKVRSMARELTDKGFKASEGITESESKTELEIIVGTASVREGCFIDSHALGLNGWTVKIVGDRVLIAGGSGNATVKALETFMRGISSQDGVLTVPRSFTSSFVPTYLLKDVTLGDFSIAEYTLVVDRFDPVPYAAATDFRSKLYEKTGIWLNSVQTDENVAHPLYFRITEDAGETGFRVTCKDGHAAVESAYSNAFQRCYTAFADDLFAMTGVAAFDDGYLRAERANVLYYSDYGAVGDGKTDDFNAICATHEAANLGGQKVKADESKTYYIGQTTRAAVIRTDTDWTGATFIIDDTVVDQAHRSYNLFQVKSSIATKTVPSTQLDGLTLKKGQTNIGLTFDTDCLIHVIWNGHKVYVRYGLNENSGSSQSEMFLVDKDGNIDPSTPVAWDYDKIDSITVYSLADTPITVEGGTFITKANNQPRAYTYYARNIVVGRPHTTLKNIVHLIQGEGDTGAPYNGFFGANRTYDVTFDNLTFTGHKAYKLATDERNTMGSYDTESSYSVKITWKDCRMSNSITDTSKWGVHASNFCKDLYVQGCSISRFDAHQGMYNVTITDTTIGFALNCIGGGLLTCENVTRYRGEAFVNLRSDYGSTWDGDAVFIDCTFEAYKDGTNTARNTTAYVFKGSYTAGWNFGYTCYMPQNVTLDNFVYKGSGSCYVFWNVEASAVTDSVNPYQICKTVTFIHMNKLGLAPNSNLSTFSSVVVTKK